METSEKQSQEDGAGEENISTLTCEICIEPFISKMKFVNNDDGCDHAFCIDCMVKYIHVMIHDNRVAEVKCPGLNCNQLLDPVTCGQILPRTSFVKWCDLLCDSALLEFERCYCPYPDCSIPIVNECGGIVQRSVCPNCKKPFCFKCKLPWHAGYQCEESGNLRDRNDILFGQLMERNRWTRCPQCGHCVERIDGCCSVRCRCNTRFCCLCGKKQEQNDHFCNCQLKSLGGIIMCAFLILLLPAAILRACYLECRKLRRCEFICCVIVLVFLIFFGVVAYRSRIKD